MHTTHPLDGAAPLLAILSCMREAVSLVDRDGVVLAVADRNEAMLGWPRAAVVGKSAFQHIHPDDLGRAAASFEELRAADRARVRADVRIAHPDGRWLWLRAEGTNLLSEPAVSAIVATFEDVSAEYAARQRLDESTELARRVADTLPIGVYVRRHPEWEFLFLSNELSTIFGQPASVTFATPESMLAAIHPEDRAAAAERLRTPPGDEDALRVRVVRPDGEVRYVANRRTSVLGPDGSGLVAGVLCDETEEHHLRAAQADASRALLAARITGGLAHDFGNFVAAIQASAETLTLSPTSDVAEEAGLILASCARANALVQKLLLVGGRGPAAVPSRTSLRREVTEAGPYLARVAGTGVVVAFEVSEDPLEVWVDPLQLHQALLNLVANARDALAGSGHVIVGARQEGAGALLWVEDDGPGIPDGIRDRLFEPFATTKASGRGTGLGLASVRAVVEGVGGTVRAVSPGRGARFELRFARVSE